MLSSLNFSLISVTNPVLVSSSTFNATTTLLCSSGFNLPRASVKAKPMLETSVNLSPICILPSSPKFFLYWILGLPAK